MHVHLNKKKLLMSKTKQAALFKLALKEKYENFNAEDIIIDHIHGKCFYKGEEYSVIFPKIFIKKVSQLRGEKIYNYNFIGKNNKMRSWVKEFEDDGIIKMTNEGRKIDKEYFDVNYYQTISQSKFTLCPRGDFNWTYRFLEAIMCKSIPIILNEQEINDFHKQFHFFLKTDEHIYSKEIAENNYQIFLKRNTL